MKNLQSTWVWTIIMFCWILVGCNKSATYRDVPIASFEQMQPFHATVERIYIEDFGKMSPGLTVIIGFRTEDAKALSIGGARSSRELASFARSLKNGETYQFPTAWLDFKRKLVDIQTR